MLDRSTVEASWEDMGFRLVGLVWGWKGGNHTDTLKILRHIEEVIPLRICCPVLLHDPHT